MKGKTSLVLLWISVNFHQTFCYFMTHFTVYFTAIKANKPKMDTLFFHFLFFCNIGHVLVLVNHHQGKFIILYISKTHFVRYALLSFYIWILTVTV
jgi:hypothetical protein